MRLRRFLDTIRTSLPRVVPLMRDPRVPAWLKAGAVVLGILIVSPVDVFGDIPGLGLLDDAVLLALLVNAFVALGLRHTMRSAGAPAGEPAPPKRARAAVYRLQP